MPDAEIEIREVSALRVDRAGRIGRLRVIGVADKHDERINVEISVAASGSSGSSWRDQHASASARIFDPGRTALTNHKAEFAADQLKPENQRRRAHMWVAEIDVLAPPAVPPIVIGRQPVPVNVRARYLYGTEFEVIECFDEIAPIDEFDLGVLFVHGIGHQRRAETLAQWSAPLLRWINAWFGGATVDLAAKLPDPRVEGWLNKLLKYERNKLDVDYVDRAHFTVRLVRKALAPTFKSWKEELEATSARVNAMHAMSLPTPQDCDDAAFVIDKLEREFQARAVGGSAELREAYVLDVGTHSIDPSSVEMRVKAMAPDGYMLRSRWMLAESHWAETFWAPSFYGFGRWCLLTAPILLVHYIALARLRHPAWLSWIPRVVALSIAVTVAQLGFALLTTLWLIPWERLRKGVLRVQLQLASVVGDSYVLLQDPVQRRAILDRVQRDLEWLVKRCRAVVLIAHSQGAAVAEIVLSQREEAGSGKIPAFATLGAGVQTLNAIGDLSQNRGAKAMGWTAITCTLALAVAAVFALTDKAGIALLVAGAALVFLVLAAYGAWTVHPKRPSMLPQAAWSRPWFDFFARKDVVPYGPLVNPENNGKNYRPKEVRNLDSYVGDHVDYWRNLEQVVGPLARQLGAAAGFKPLETLLPDDDATFAKLERARISRLGFLNIARFVIFVATATLLWVNRSEWAAIGTWAIDWAQSKLGLASTAMSAPALGVWLSALAVLLPLLVQKALINPAFDGWTLGEVERLLRRSAGSPATHWAVVFTVVLVIVLAATIQYVWPFSPTLGVGATVFAAAVLAWIAQRTHRRRVLE